MADRLMEKPFYAKLQRELDSVLLANIVDWEEVRRLMSYGHAGVRPNIVDRSTGLTTAHMAAFEGQLDILRWCIESGVDVNIRNNLGRSPLHYACNGNRVSCIRLLLENGADPNILSLSQQTPLHLCCLYNHYEATLELVHGTNVVLDIDGEDSRRKTPEALTTDKQVQRALRKYRATFDERREAELLEQAIHRIFSMLDREKTSSVLPEQVAKIGAVMDQCLPRKHLSGAVRAALESSDTNFERAISWQEFKAAHVSAFQSQAGEFRELMTGLNNLENSIFKQSVGVDKPITSAGYATDVVVTSPTSREAAARRLSRPLISAGQAMFGQMPMAVGA